MMYTFFEIFLANFKAEGEKICMIAKIPIGKRKSMIQKKKYDK